jgi:pSer/pThr/pTyr-binding forkhead associated (FHA) protein
MARLVVSLEGGHITEYDLDIEKEYLLGRGTQCDILLPHPKVSRQHARIFYDGKHWNCKVVSKFGFLTVNGHNSSEISLVEGVHFGIPPYEIRFHAQEKAVVPNKTSQEEYIDDKTDDLNDRTRVGSVQLKAVLLHLDKDGEVNGELVLTNETITAGRGSNCDLLIEDTHASRKHFSIHYDGKDYVLRDLGSSNKTYINGKEVTEHRLQSGDEIQVGKDRHRFEVMNPEFENLPAVVAQNQAPPQPAVIKYLPQDPVPPMAQFLSTTIRKINTTSNARLKISAIVVIFGFVIYSALTGNNKSNDLRNIASQPLPNGQAPSSFDRLPPDQKKYVDETYNLALNLVTTGKYDLAAIEINKVLQIVNNYKDARNMQSLCQQATEIKKQQDESERQNQDQEALKQKVSDILDGCDNLFKAKKYAKIEECTNQISELDPENERASNMRIAAKQALDEIATSKEQIAESAHRKIMAQKNYEQSKRDVAAKRFPAALSNLQKVEKSNFPDSEGLKEKAKQDIVIVKARMLKESQALVAEGKTSFDAKEFAEALNKFNQALVLAPFNDEAKSMRSTATRELHVEMKNMYSESVIEENLGNIESAKKKWAVILKQDDKSDPYYEKAQIKLRKYEK